MVLMYILGIQHVLDTKVVNMLSIGELLRWILSTPMQFIIGRRFYTGTYKALRQGSANMDVLIALEKNIAAYFYYVYFVLRAASSILIAFILLGKYLEVLAKGKTFEVDGTLQRIEGDALSAYGSSAAALTKEKPLFLFLFWNRTLSTVDFQELLLPVFRAKRQGTDISKGGGRDAHKQEEIKQYYRSFLWSLIFTISVFLTSMVLMYILGIQHVLDTKEVNMLSIGELLRWILSTPMQFIIGRRFYTGTYKALRQGSANMDVLIALEKNIAAYFYYVYFVLRAASSILIAFILLGKYLEVLAKGKTFEVDGTLQRIEGDALTAYGSSAAALTKEKPLFLFWNRTLSKRMD
ncbi:unnamed protein product [Ilex paraguariensis]|uniref:ABC transmembrane type-1 domain-containing protein n=1 Tax=Ilex paraguariensis TaxID=185542 RepID=A0ABC8R5G4_9AQUA